MQSLKKRAYQIFKALLLLVILSFAYRFGSIALFKETLFYVCEMTDDRSFPKLPRSDRFSVYFEYRNPWSPPWGQERWLASSSNFPELIEGSWSGSSPYPHRTVFRGEIRNKGIFDSGGSLFFNRLNGFLDFQGSQKITFPDMYDGIEQKKYRFLRNALRLIWIEFKL